MRAIWFGSALLAFAVSSSPQSFAIQESTRQPDGDEQSRTKADTPQSPNAPSGKPQASPARPQSPKKKLGKRLKRHALETESLNVRAPRSLWDCCATMRRLENSPRG